MGARRGLIYALAVGDEEDDPDFVRPFAEQALVLSEDAWNETMQTSVIVPIYRREQAVGERAALLQPSIGAARYADCTLIQSLDDDDRGKEIETCDGDVLSAVVTGVRAYLDLDSLLAQRIRRLPARGRSTFWPRQRDVYWGRRDAGQRERYLIVADDEFNIRSDHTAAMFLTSRDKTWRSRWQVPAGGGFVISGDIDQFDYNELDDRNRPEPRELSRAQMAEVARAVADLLELSSTG